MLTYWLIALREFPAFEEDTYIHPLCNLYQEIRVYGFQCKLIAGVLKYKNLKHWISSIHAAQQIKRKFIANSFIYKINDYLSEKFRIIHIGKMTHKIITRRPFVLLKHFKGLVGWLNHSASILTGRLVGITTRSKHFLKWNISSRWTHHSIFFK